MKLVPKIVVSAVLRAGRHGQFSTRITPGLLTVPVTPDRLDIYARFLAPAECRPRRQIAVESTDLMLQLVAAGRGVSALPDWLIAEDAGGMPIRTLRIGRHGLHKRITLGVRRDEAQNDYIVGLMEIAGGIAPLSL